MKTILALAMLGIVGCVPLPAREVAVLQDCSKSGGVPEERFNPLNPMHPITWTCVPAKQIK